MSEATIGENLEPKAGLAEEGAVPPGISDYIEDTEKAPTDAELAGREVESGKSSESETEESNKKEPDEKKDKKVVPLAALHEEREKRKELSKRLEEAESKRIADLAKVEERVNIILSSLQPKEEPKPATDIPPFLRQYFAVNPGASEKEALEAFFKEEPTNYLKFHSEIIAKQQDAIIESTKKQDEAAKVQTQFNNFVRVYQTQAQEFAAKTPEFTQAYNFLLQQRSQELELMGFDAAMRSQILQNEEMGIVEQAFRNNKNPAEAIFEIAKFRGFKVPAAVAAGKTPEQIEAEKKAATLDAEKKAAIASKSLGAVPGSSGGRLSAEALISMTEEEFAAATEGGNWEKFFNA